MDIQHDYNETDNQPGGRTGRATHGRLSTCPYEWHHRRGWCFDDDADRRDHDANRARLALWFRDHPPAC
jgi:hypothetical protein